MDEKYFPVGTHKDDRGFILGARASIALRILDHFAIIAATDGGEDSAGRHRLKLNEPGALVDRAFAIASIFVARAEQLDEIVKQDPEAVARQIGRLHGITEDEKYNLGRRIRKDAEQAVRRGADTTGGTDTDTGGQ